MINQDINIGRQGMLMPDPLDIVSDNNYSNVSAISLEKQRRSGNNPFTVDSGLAQSIRDTRQQTEDTIGRAEFGVGEDMFIDERQNQGFIETSLGDNVRAGNEGQLTVLQDQQTANALRQQGLEPVYELNQFQGYQYNPQSGEYDYYDNSPNMLREAVRAIGKGIITGVATGGIGGLLSSGLGVSTGIGKALAGAGLQGLMGESIDPESVAKSIIIPELLQEAGLALDAIDTGSDVVNSVVKDVGLGILKGEDPKQAVLKSVLKNAEIPENLAQWGREFDDNYLQPIKNALGEAFDVDVEGGSELLADLDQVIRDLPTTKEDWKALEDAYHENIEDPLEEFAGDVSDAIPDEVKDFAKDTGKSLLDLGKDLLLGGLSGVTGGSGQMVAGGSQKEPVDLTTVELLDPLRSDNAAMFDLSNPFFNERAV